MMKILFGILLLVGVSGIEVPEVKVSDAMKNIMMQGDLSAHINLDTLNKTHLFGLGPVAGLKGEIMILDGKVYSTAIQENQLLNQQDKISQAAMLVYSHVEKWKPVISKVKINNYAELEKLIETTATINGYDTEIPFVFKIETTAGQLAYHVIDWKEGTTHTMENHKQFAYAGHLDNTS
jgi:acetolactate decarboxylase